MGNGSDYMKCLDLKLAEFKGVLDSDLAFWNEKLTESKASQQLNFTFPPQVINQSSELLWKEAEYTPDLINLNCFGSTSLPITH